jgi:hypothetical protein
MNEATKREYLRLAAHFYEHRLGGLPPSPKRVQDALRACAEEYRPAYWRRLRKAISVAQEEAGYPEAAERIAGTKNPLTATPGQLALHKDKIKPKQRRARGIKPEDAARLAEHFDEQGDTAALGVIVYCQQLGLRPAEIAGTQVRPDGLVTISGAKGRADRGISTRVLQVDPRVAAVLIKARGMIEAKAEGDVAAEVGRVQDRVPRAARKLWPRRKALPSLYSFRHQLGSELKASGLDRVQIAYVMGHRSTESVEVYGDRRRSSSGRMPVPAASADLSQVKENHRERTEKPAKRQEKQLNMGFDGGGPSL